VKLPDVNVLVYAIDEDSRHHATARPWLEEALSGSETLAFCWNVLLGFVRLSTRLVVFERPLDASEALDQNQTPWTDKFRNGNRRFLTKRLWGRANQPPYFHHDCSRLCASRFWRITVRRTRRAGTSSLCRNTIRTP